MGMWKQADREIHREIRKRYPSDLTDGEWALTTPFFATYRPLSTTIRAIVEACLYLVAEGCRWRALLKDFPPWQSTRGKTPGRRMSLTRLAYSAPRILIVWRLRMAN